MKLLHDDAGSVALTTIALLPLFLVVLAGVLQLGALRVSAARVRAAADLAALVAVNDQDDAELARTGTLRLAADAKLESVAFPCISTGVFGYPKQEACDIAVAAVADWLAAHDLPLTVTFCCFDEADADRYRARLLGDAT